MPASLACRVGAPAPTTRPGSACSRAQLARGASRPARVGRDVAAKAGYGFLEDEDGAQGTRVDEGKLYVPRYGLTVNQMQALGITNDSFLQREEPDPASISAKAFYVGDEITETTRQTTRMGGPGMRPPGQAPPDLPSLLLDGRICYIGMPLVPQVSELVISELLWLNYSNPEKPVYLYLNSTGSQTDGPQKQAVGFETEAYAILDTLNYIRPDIHTLAVGAAYGNAAMLLASGKKGYRAALPHARIKTAPPRLNRAMGNASRVMVQANELEDVTETYKDFMCKFTGQPREVIEKDVGRDKYFTPEQAVDYGLIDRIVQPDSMMFDKQDYESMLASSGRGRPGAAAQPGMA